MPKLLILSKNADEYCRLIESARLTGLDITTIPTPDCDLVFGEPNLICGVLQQLPALKWVQATWAGVEPLLDSALRRDYLLTNARGVFGGLMSEFVFGYLLLHERRILERLQAQRENRWDATLTGTLRGKTLGLLGVGSIGAELARTAKFFGMNVRGYTRESENSKFVDQYYHLHPPPSPLGRGRQKAKKSPLPLGEGQGSPTQGGEGQAGLTEFAAGLDYLVSVLPNTQETRKIVSAELLVALPKHAIFINVGRGSAVDESALIQALETESIVGAVLDVFEQEPLPAEHPFWGMKNLLLTFHTSAPSFPADITHLFVENYQLFIQGQPLRYRVDFERGY
jgi:phosphoglycerate dehydrogenase-like enzyme